MTERIPYGGNVTIWQLKERIIHAGNVTNRHLQRVISFNTIELYMQGVGPSDNFKGWYHSTLVICTWKIIHAGNVTIRQQIRVIALDTSKLFIKERSIRKECDHQAFSNDDLTQHLILSLFISNNHLWFSNGTRFSHQHHIIQFGTPNIP